MSPDFPEPPPPPPPPAEPATRQGGRLRLLAIALGIAIAGATAGFIVTHAASPEPANTTAAASKPSPSPGAHQPALGPRGGFGSLCGATFSGAGFGSSFFGGGFSGGGFCGGETGTVTKISGSTLTLRTLAGTVTVTTSSSTTFSREEQQVHFSAVKVGDVVAVRGSRTGASPTATSPIAAKAITIEVPSFSGRVQSVSGNTVTLVTGDGQLEYVTLSGSTLYHGVRGASATSSSVKAGVFIVAQGTQVDLTTLKADDVQVLGTLSFTPHGFQGHSGTMPPAQPPAAAKSV
ncbi:MAG: DUF5666 domain-containing protein [Candidatus Dormiibacterota bacterium]